MAGALRSSTNKRPVSVTVVAWIYILTGAVGIAYHSTELSPRHPFKGDLIWIELVRLLAIVAGAYLLRGRNWARWLAIFWIAFHVVLSAFHSPPELAVHAVLCVLFAWLLFRPAASLYLVQRRSAHVA